MQTKIIHKFDVEDPAYSKQIDEAFNRVISFCPELLAESSPEKTSFNRVTNGEFDKDDLVCLLKLSEMANERVRAKYAAMNTDADPKLAEFAASVIQAGDNVNEVMVEVFRFVTHG